MPLLRRLAYAGLALACSQVVLSALLPAGSRGPIRLALGGAAALAVLLGVGRRERATSAPTRPHGVRGEVEPSAHVVAADHAPPDAASDRAALVATADAAAEALRLDADRDTPLDATVDAAAAAPAGAPARRRAPTLAVLLARGADF